LNKEGKSLQQETASPSEPSEAQWTPRSVDPLIEAYRPAMVTMPDDATWLTDAGRARISGSDHGLWIIERLCAEFCKIHPKVDFDIDLRGTPSAMAFLMSGKAMFSVMGREITPIEMGAYAKSMGTAPVEFRVAHTAEETSQHLATSLAVYVHRSNPLAALTQEQLSQIFTIGNSAGDFSRWGQLRLKGEWEKRLIHPIGTPEFTGFGTYMQKHHLGGRPFNPLYERYVGTEDVLARLAAAPTGIAVAALGCETDFIRQVPLAIDETATPSNGATDDVRNGRYAFGRFLYFYVPQRPGHTLCPSLQEYLRFVLSADGQAIIAAQPRGYIPLRSDEIAEELQKIDAIAPVEMN
jgi:phosphate transport system substrate-binding protein